MPMNEDRQRGAVSLGETPGETGRDCRGDGERVRGCWGVTLPCQVLDTAGSTT